MRLKFLSLVLCFTGFIYGQELNLIYKRIGGVGLYSGRESKYQYDYLGQLNLAFERGLRSKYFTLGVDFGYCEKHPVLIERYDYLGGSENFFDRSLSIGFFGRVYSNTEYIKFFGELATYSNYIHVKQPIVIYHAFGRYEKIIDNKQFAISGSISLGFSMGFKFVKLEPFIQFGIISDIPERRLDQVFTSSVGLVSGRNTSFLIAPLNLKFLLK